MGTGPALDRLGDAWPSRQPHVPAEPDLVRHLVARVEGPVPDTADFDAIRVAHFATGE